MPVFRVDNSGPKIAVRYDGAFQRPSFDGGFPTALNNKRKMLRKSRYRASAPMIAFFPAITSSSSAL
jgi:hypothetical protein